MIEVYQCLTLSEALAWIDNSKIGNDCIVDQMFGRYVVYHNKR